MKKLVLLTSLLTAIASTTAVQAHPVAGPTDSQSTWSESIWDQMGE